MKTIDEYLEVAHVHKREGRPFSPVSHADLVAWQAELAGLQACLGVVRSVVSYGHCQSNRNHDKAKDHQDKPQAETEAAIVAGERLRAAFVDLINGPELTRSEYRRLAYNALKAYELSSDSPPGSAYWPPEDPRWAEAAEAAEAAGPGEDCNSDGG